MHTLEVVFEPKSNEKPVSCTLAIDFAKEGMLAEIADKLSFQVRKHKITYRQLCDVFERVRKENNLRRPKRERRLPQLLTEPELDRFFANIKNVEHELMMRFLLYTAVRVNELVNIKASHVDPGNCTVRIEQGKGSKDRYVLFPTSLRLVLSTYLHSHPDHEYLFESRCSTKYSPRRIQQIMREYGRRAGLGDRVHPHLFRHQQLTALTRSGLSDAQIQLISGHASKQSLEVYQHLGLESVADAYQAAVRGVA
jgi:integrase/recombinase XerD